MRLFILAFITFPISFLAQQMIGESVEHDPASNRFFTSSDNNSIVQRAANGTVSYFGSGLDADFGMEVMGNTLFALTGTRLKGYDLDTEQEVFDLNIPGAGFLNGLTNDGNNRLWATDFSNDRIYEIDASDFTNPSFSIVVGNTQSQPNGIIHDGDNNRLIFVSWGGGNIHAVDLLDYSVSTIIDANLNNMDGIDEDNEGSYYVSSWSPLRITKFANDFSSSEIVAVSGLNSPADICYAKTIDTLGIPSTSQQAIFIGFGLPNGIGENQNIESVNMSPNPVVNNASITVQSSIQSELHISVYDLNGRIVKTLNTTFTNTTSHLDLNFLRSGTYLLRIEGENVFLNYPFIKI